MKRFALALTLVLAFSTAAMAIDFTSSTMNVVGVTKFVNGVQQASVNTDNRTLKMKVEGTGWKAMAEYSGNPAGLDDWYFQTKEGAWLWEMWGKGEDQNNDKATPFGWINATDDAPSTWEVRVSGPVAGVDTVMSVEDAGATGSNFYLFVDKKLGAVSVGAAAKTNMKKDHTFAGYATNDLGPVTVTGEVAMLKTATADNINVGAKAVFDSGINAQVYRTQANKKLYIDVYTNTKGLKFVRGQVTDDTTKTNIVIDAAVRAANDVDARYVIKTYNATADAHIWNYSNKGTSYNAWQTVSNWALGANINTVKAKPSGATLTSYTVGGAYRPMSKLALFGGFNIIPASAGTTWLLDARARYDVTSKFFVMPQAQLDDAGNVAVAGLAELAVNKGRVVAYALSTKPKGSNSTTTIWAGYNLSF